MTQNAIFEASYFPFTSVVWLEKIYILDHCSINTVSTKYELCIISSFNVMNFEKWQFQLFVRTAKIYVFQSVIISFSNVARALKFCM